MGPASWIRMWWNELTWKLWREKAWQELVDANASRSARYPDRQSDARCPACGETGMRYNLVDATAKHEPLPRACWFLQQTCAECGYFFGPCRPDFREGESIAGADAA